MPIVIPFLFDFTSTPLQVVIGIQTCTGVDTPITKLLGIPKTLRAILKCLDCCGGQDKEIRECVDKNCALYPYRMGRYPKALSILAAARSSGRDLPPTVNHPSYSMTI